MLNTALSRRLKGWGLPIALLLAAALVVVTAGNSTAAAAEEPISRAEFARLLVDAAKIAGEGDAPQLLVEKGLLQGYPDGDLRLEGPISQEEAIVLIGRALGLRDDFKPPAAVETPVPEDHWSYNLFAWLTRHKALPEELAAPGQLLQEEQARQLLATAFTNDDEAITVVEQSREQSLAKQESAAALQTAGAMQMELRARPDAEEPLPAGAMGISMSFSQTIILPDLIHQSSTMPMDMPGLSDDELNLAGMSTEMYWFDGALVQKLPDPVTGEVQWMRMPPEITPDFTVMMELAQQQTQAIPPGMEDYFYYKLLGKEERDGEEVYVIGFYGQVADFAQFMDTLLHSFGEVMPLPADEEEGLNAFDLIQGMSYWGIDYVSTDDLLSRGMDYSSIVLYTEEVDGEANPLEAMLMHMQLEAVNYPDDLVLEIPAEVKDAPLLDLDMEPPAADDEDPSVDEEDLSAE